jgi:hypothetical protein
VDSRLVPPVTVIGRSGLGRCDQVDGFQVIAPIFTGKLLNLWVRPKAARNPLRVMTLPQSSCNYQTH